MGFNFSEGRLGRFTLNKGCKLILINDIYAKLKKNFFLITISRGTPVEKPYYRPYVLRVPCWGCFGVNYA
jgi:hypothetical protein